MKAEKRVEKGTRRKEKSRNLIEFECLKHSDYYGSSSDSCILFF